MTEPKPFTHRCRACGMLSTTNWGVISCLPGRKEHSMQELSPGWEPWMPPSPPRRHKVHDVHEMVYGQGDLEAFLVLAIIPAVVVIIPALWAYAAVKRVRCLLGQHCWHDETSEDGTAEYLRCHNCDSTR
jgi:hypothetical protein